MILQKCFFIFTVCFAATIPFDLQLSFTNLKINNIFLVLLVAVAIPLGVRNAKQLRKADFGPMLSFVGLYVLLMAGTLYSENTDQALSDLLEKKIGLLVFPIIFCFLPRLNARQTKTVLLGFTLSCAVTAMYCLSIALFHYAKYNDSTFLSYHSLSQIAGMHAIYMAMCFCFAIAILFHYLLSGHSNSRQVLAYSSVAALLCISIFLLAGRTHIFLLLCGGIALSVWYFSRRNTLLTSFLKSAAVGLLMFVIVLAIPQNRERFKQLINYNNEYGITKKWGEQQMRPLMWDCALQLIRRAPVIGLGTGDVLDNLHQCYIDNEYVTLTYFENVRFNAHNQYIEIFLGLGIVGLLIFLAGLWVAGVQAIRLKKRLQLLFLVIIIVSSLTESILERQTGVAFYAFFNALLFFSEPTTPGQRPEGRTNKAFKDGRQSSLSV